MKTKHKSYGPYERYFKRPVDILCSLLALIVFSWLYIIIAVLIMIKLGRPVLFTQERPGKNEKIFKLYKFRTMTNERDADGNLLPDEIRLTKFGKFLRSTSLDELPELINIIKGDMSIVGPRPLLIGYLPFYSKEEKRRHDVRPGLTGWAQVNGRNFIDWDHRLEKDIEYVNNVSIVLDIKIIITTIMLVLKKSDVATDTRKVESNFAEERKAKLGIK